MRVSLELMKNALTSLAKSEEAQDLAQWQKNEKWNHAKYRVSK